MTIATRAVAAGKLSHRIHLEGRSDEFAELADSFDTMLARIAANVTEQGRFAANASHELRTPLAITQSLLDVACTDQDLNVNELIDRLYAVNKRAVNLTDALMTLSRADRRAFTPEQVDLSLCIEDALETVLPLAEKHQISIHTSGKSAFVNGSRSLITQMMVNLVHNAIVHNLPKNGSVQILTTMIPGFVVITIENTGEELPEELLPTLTEPFQRAGQRTHTDHAGVGLGLAIVDSIIRSHNGSLTLAPGSNGGLHITVHLPHSEL